MNSNHAYALAVEKLGGVPMPLRAELMRVMVAELNRISSHMVCLGALAMDMGAYTPFLHGIAHRELVNDIFEDVCGARLTYCYYRFGGLYNDADDEFLTRVRAFVKHMPARLKMNRDLVTGNIIVRKRLEGIGEISADMCRRYGATGPVIRGSGVAYDVRKAEPYSVYPKLDFKIPVYNECDSMARYLVRMDEMEVSLHIIEQCLDMIQPGPFMAPKVPRVLKLPVGDTTYAVEAARGRFMVRVVSDNKDKPYRVKLRTPCFSNLSLFEEASRGMMLADALALLGSLDLVIPDIDR
jgi:NADH-quinone oxidoreductase subunit D